MTFFDKMSYHGARVKVKRGMVKVLQPCVYGHSKKSSIIRNQMTNLSTARTAKDPNYGKTGLGEGSLVDIFPFQSLFRIERGESKQTKQKCVRRLLGKLTMTFKEGYRPISDRYFLSDLSYLS